VAPLGKPETEKEIVFVLPDFSAALIVFCAEAPLFAALSPVFDSEKSKELFIVNHAFASSLSGEFFLKAFALTSVCVVRVKGSL
jgi:hypothetical protein